MILSPTDRLSTREAAEFLGITLGAMKQRVNRRQVPHYKVGKRLWFSRDEMRQHLENITMHRDAVAA
jgi:excisionase family DNA binding protein